MHQSALPYRIRKYFYFIANHQFLDEHLGCNGAALTLVTPNPGGGAFTHYMYYDGNGNISKTTDFKAVSHYYAFDMLNRMTGHGSNSSANDETYTFGCCSKLNAYTDAQGTADLQYDQLNRLLSHEDSNGNTVTYAFDAMGRTQRGPVRRHLLRLPLSR